LVERFGYLVVYDSESKIEAKLSSFRGSCHHSEYAAYLGHLKESVFFQQCYVGRPEDIRNRKLKVEWSLQKSCYSLALANPKEVFNISNGEKLLCWGSYPWLSPR
jgi:hypothetical protein